MGPDRTQQISHLYQGALARRGDERAAFLVEACRGDEALRREVESLLAQPESAQAFLDAPALAHAARMVGEAGASAALVGRRLGAYQIQALLGAGGMGEVYRARDTKLGRDVAIKILPHVFTTDPGRLARFEREARTLAALNHPHIGAIYGVEEAEGVRALVLELVEGSTLADRLDQGPVPVGDALAIGRQIAEALEAAHEKGVIHRDLKPANVKVTPDGRVKVLDFGLAKALLPESDDSPTLKARPTEAGAILGTPAYMSPEQARGETVGVQADIWSFGALLYELLTGISPFGRPTSAETLASVLGPSPDFDRLPPETPAIVSRLLRRCLEKDRKRRVQHMGDVRIEIDDALTAAPIESREIGAGGRRRSSLVWGAGALGLAALAGGAGWWMAQRSTSASKATVHLSIPALELPRRGAVGVSNLAVSRDGSTVAYASVNRLWIRRLDQPEAVAVEVQAMNPFFSPDGQLVGFQQGNDGLATMRVVGGTPEVLYATTERPAGAAWGADGTIVFATTAGLYRISASGGERRMLAKPDPAHKERLYAWPRFTPDGRFVLFTIVTDGAIAGLQIAAVNLETLEVTPILKGGSAAQYVPTGHLVYASGQSLKAVAFDLGKMQTRGDSRAIPDIQVTTAPDNGAAEFDVSETGTLVSMVVAPPLLRTLSVFDRRGVEESLPIAPGFYQYPRVSPDGTRVATEVFGANRDIWIWNFQRPGLTKLTSGPTEDLLPVWSTDSQRVFFSSNRSGEFDVYSQAADGATDARVEYSGPATEMATSALPDGSGLVVSEDFKDISLWRHAQPDRLQPLLHSQHNEWNGVVSPDGKWIAYESDEAGDVVEIFLRPFPNVDDRRQRVSIDGGRWPLWGAPGSGELFYTDFNGGFMSVAVTSRPSLTLGRVTRLFDWDKPPRDLAGRPYDLSPVDGRFLRTRTVADAGQVATINMSVVLNWLRELQSSP